MMDRSPLKNPRLIRFDFCEGLVIEFTRRICHALALELRKRMGWGLVGIHEEGRDGPNHIACSRRRPPKTMPESVTPSGDGDRPMEYVDVRGVFADPEWFFRVDEAPVGHVHPISEKRVERLQDEEYLTCLTPEDREAAQRVAPAVEHRVEQVDAHRPYRGCSATVVSASLMAAIGDGHIPEKKVG